MITSGNLSLALPEVIREKRTKKENAKHRGINTKM